MAEKSEKGSPEDFTNFITSVNVPPESNINADTQYLSKIIEEVFSKKDIELKTDLNESQIIAFSQARAFAERYNTPLLETLVENISLYSVSKGRKGRKEFEKITSSMYSMSGETEGKSISQRLLGRE